MCQRQKKEQGKDYAKQDVVKFYLDRAGHRTEGKHCSTVLYGGLAVKGSLSVNEENSNLQTAASLRMLLVKINY